MQDIYRFDARRLIAGRIETGRLAVGDTLTFFPGGRSSRVATFERWNGPDRDYAIAGECITLTLEEQIFVERGHVATVSGEQRAESGNAKSASPAHRAPLTAHRLRANLFWMSGKPWETGEKLRLKLGTQETGARIVRIESVTDAATLESSSDGKTAVGKNDVAEVVIETDRPLAFDPHDVNPTLGRFVVVQERRVAGGGILLGAEAGSEAADARNIVRHDTKVTYAERAKRHGYRGAVIWLTGLSGAGKSTIAAQVNRALFDRGMQATLLDGDNLRHGLCADLGFTDADRTENIRRAAHVARLFAESGMVTLTAFISPTRADRDAAREVARQGGIPFVEVYVEASLETCEARDPKGLYRRARAGEIRQFTGIDSPYEPPASPDLILSTEDLSPEAAADTLLEYVLALVTGRAVGAPEWEI